jgi:hypothetical protein
MAKRYNEKGEEVEEAFLDSTAGKITLATAGTTAGVVGTIVAKKVWGSAASEGTKNAFRGSGSRFNPFKRR